NASPVNLDSWRTITDWVTGVTLAELVMAWGGLRSPWLRGSVWAIWLGSQAGRASLLYRVGDILSLGLLAYRWWGARKWRPRGERHWAAVVMALVILTHLNRSGGLGAGVLGLPAAFRIGRHSFGTLGVAVTLFTVVLTVLLIRQLTADRREKLRLASEVESA